MNLIKNLKKCCKCDSTLVYVYFADIIIRFPRFTSTEEAGGLGFQRKFIMTFQILKPQLSIFLIFVMR